MILLQLPTYILLELHIILISLIIYKPSTLIISPWTFSMQLGASTLLFCLSQYAIPFCTLSMSANFRYSLGILVRSMISSYNILALLCFALASDNINWKDSNPSCQQAFKNTFAPISAIEGRVFKLNVLLGRKFKVFSVQLIVEFVDFNQLWPRTIGHSLANGVTNRSSSNDKSQARLIGNVTISFTKLLTVPSIRNKGNRLVG